MTTLFAVKGLAELKAKFEQVSRDTGKVVVRKMAGAGAQVVKKAIANVPIPIAPKPHRKGLAPGVLRRAEIIKYVREKSNDNQALYIVTFRQGKKASGKGRDAFYAKYVERGHRIVKRSRRIGTYRGKALNARTIRARRADAAASGGFVQGRFFMKQGFAASRDAAAEAMVAAGDEQMRKVIAQ